MGSVGGPAKSVFLARTLFYLYLFFLGEAGKVSCREYGRNKAPFLHHLLVWQLGFGTLSTKKGHLGPWGRGVSQSRGCRIEIPVLSQKGPDQEAFLWILWNLVSLCSGGPLGLRRCYLEEMYPWGSMVTCMKANVYLPVTQTSVWAQPCGHQSRVATSGVWVGAASSTEAGRQPPPPHSTGLLTCQGALAMVLCPVCSTFVKIYKVVKHSYLKSCRVMYFFKEEKTTDLLDLQWGHVR